MNTNHWVSCRIQWFATYCFTCLASASFSGKKQELQHKAHLKVRQVRETNALSQMIPRLHPNHRTHTANHLQPQCQKEPLPTRFALWSAACVDTPPGEYLKMDQSVSAGNRKSGGGTLYSNWKWRCLFFSIAKWYLTSHLIKKGFPSGLNHKVSQLGHS